VAKIASTKKSNDVFSVRISAKKRTDERSKNVLCCLQYVLDLPAMEARYLEKYSITFTTCQSLTNPFSHKHITQKCRYRLLTCHGISARSC
ncbi:hypothetical protein MAR_032136, partial [Mya arenaria]